MEEGDSLEYLYTTLRHASAQLNLKANSTDEMVFLLGNTRAGKSTLRMLLCNNSREFKGLNVIGDPPCIADPSGEIGDDSGFSRTTLPKTFHPSQMQNSCDITWVDASGWGCNRSTYTDIEGMYLLNQLANPTKKLKFLVVIPYPAFYPDSDRRPRLESFQFAAQITDHITDEGSVGVVVTKVDVDVPHKTAMSNITSGLKSLCRRGDRTSFVGDDDDDGVATDEENAKMQKIFSVIDCVLRHNRICMVRRPQKNEGVKSQPLFQILTDPTDKNSPPYHETVCRQLQILWEKLVYACKREDFTIAFNELMVMDLRTQRLPNIEKRIRKVVRTLVRNMESLMKKHVKTLTNGGNGNKLEVVNTLTQALQQIPVDFGNLDAGDHSTTKNCSQVIRKCLSCFHSNQFSSVLVQLEELEERFHFVQEVTQISFTGKLESHVEIMRFRNELQSTLKQILMEYEKELRPKLESQIKKEVESLVENMKREYKTRHQYWSKNIYPALQGLAVSKVECHIVSMNVLLTSDLNKVEGGVIEQIYQVLTLVITDSIRRQFSSLNQAVITLIALNHCSTHWGYETVRKMKQFLELLRNTEVVAKWKRKIEPEIQETLRDILRAVKDNWLESVPVSTNETIKAKISIRKAKLADLICFLEAYLSELHQSMKTSVPKLSEQVAKFSEKLENICPKIFIQFNQSTFILLEQVGGANFEDVEKNCCYFWYAHTFQLLQHLKLLFSVYKYLGGVHNLVSDSYEAQQKLREIQLLNIIDPSDLLVHLSFTEQQFPLEQQIDVGILANENHTEERKIFQDIFKNVDIPKKIWIDESKLLILAERSVFLSDLVNEEFSEPRKYNQLSVFIVAGETVFLDTDWIQGNGEIRTVFICASQLKCNDNCRLTLIGPAGRGGLGNGSFIAVKAEDGIRWGESGRDGLDGGYGGQGANVCMLLENPEGVSDSLPLLEINCQGGRGGFGMNGGNGHCGFRRSLRFINSFYQLKRNLKHFDRTFTQICKHLGLQSPNFREYQLNESEDMKTSNWRLAKKVQYRLGTMLTFTFFTFYLWRDNGDEFRQHCFCSMLHFCNFVDTLWNTPNLLAPVAGGGGEDKGIFQYDSVKFYDIIDPLLREKLGDKPCSRPGGEQCPVASVEYSTDNNYFDRYVSQILLLWKQLNQPGIAFQAILEIGVGLTQKCQYLCEDLHEGNIIPRIQISRTNPMCLCFSTRMFAIGGWMKGLRNSDKESGGAGGKGGDGGLGGCPGRVKIYTTDGRVDPKDLSLLKVHSSHGPVGPPGQGGVGGEHGNCSTRKLNRANVCACDGVPGNSAQIPDSCLRDCKENSDMWEMEIAHALWKAVEQIKGSSRKLLISRLEAYDWSIQRQLFTTEYWVDEYLLVSLNHADEGRATNLFTKDHLEVEQAFQKRLEKFQKLSKVVGMDQGKVISFLLKNSHDKTDALRSLVECTPSIVHLEKALTHCPTAITNFQASRRYVNCLKQQAKFEEELDSDIAKAKEQAEVSIAKKLEEIEKTLAEQKERYREDLNDYVNLLERKGMYEKAENILKALRIAMAPACGLATGGGETRREVGGRVGASLLLLLTKLAKPKVKNPEALTQKPLNSLARLMKETPRMVRRQIEALELVTREYADLNASLQGCLQQLQDMLLQFEKCSAVVNVAKTTKLEDARFLECLQEFEKIKKEMFQLIKNLRNSYPDTHNLATVLDYLYVDLITADTDAELYKKTRDSVLESVAQHFWTLDNDTSAAMQRRDMVDEKYVPAVDHLLSVVKSKLGGDPYVKIETWKLKDMLKEMKEYLAHFVKGLPSEDQFKKAFEKIQQALDTRLKFYDKVSQRGETSRMAKFIAGFHFNAEELEEYNISEELKRKLARIQMLTRAELLLMEYQSLKCAFFQWTFPYTEKYINKPIQDLIVLVQDLCSGGSNSGSGGSSTGEYHHTPEENIVTAALECQKLLHHFIDKSKKNEASVSTLDEVYFTKEFTVTNPFYEWNNDEWGVEIRNLLLGQPTNFEADVRKSPLGMGAIKANGSIQLKFSCRDRPQTEMQKELDTYLNKFLLEMVHCGNSRYRLGSNYYHICGEKMALRGKVQQTFGLGDEGNSANDTRGKMQDFVLSPYTDWTFRLIPEHQEDNGSSMFTVLADKFAHCIDLQLVGWGRHLIETGSAWNLHKPVNVDSFYDRMP